MSHSNRTARLALALGGLLVTDLLLPPLQVAGPSPASAVVGRPLTPVSYAGVARRTTRRAVVVTGAAAAAATPTTVVVVEQAPAPAAPAPAAPPPNPQ